MGDWTRFFVVCATQGFEDADYYEIHVAGMSGVDEADVIEGPNGFEVEKQTYLHQWAQRVVIKQRVLDGDEYMKIRESLPRTVKNEADFEAIFVNPEIKNK